MNLAGQLQLGLGSAAKWAFLIGAWGAIFSSMLGVWQSVPYLFTDFWGLVQNRAEKPAPRSVDTRSLPYRAYLVALATLPAAGLWTSFQLAQKIYAVVGALCIPMLALVLLVLNGQSRLVGRENRNSVLVTVVLGAALVFFAVVGWLQIQSRFAG